MNDIYQKRYIAHQAKKKEQLAHNVGSPYEKRSEANFEDLRGILESRRSQRLFNKEEITEDELNKLLDLARKAPSSCNRHGIKLLTVMAQDDKDLLTGLLVGGIGWVHRAQIIILFMADESAYKSPNEKDFMHYCDVGFLASYLWLTAESLNIGAAYINPNIRNTNKYIFQERFGDGIFCGALALGKYDLKALEPDYPSVDEILL